MNGWSIKGFVVVAWLGLDVVHAMLQNAARMVEHSRESPSKTRTSFVWGIGKMRQRFRKRMDCAH